MSQGNVRETCCCCIRTLLLNRFDRVFRVIFGQNREEISKWTKKMEKKWKSIHSFQSFAPILVNKSAPIATITCWFEATQRSQVKLPIRNDVTWRMSHHTIYSGSLSLSPLSCHETREFDAERSHNKHVRSFYCAFALETAHSPLCQHVRRQRVHVHDIIDCCRPHEWNFLVGVLSAERLRFYDYVSCLWTRTLTQGEYVYERHCECCEMVRLPVVSRVCVCVSGTFTNG